MRVMRVVVWLNGGAKAKRKMRDSSTAGAETSEAVSVAVRSRCDVCWSVLFVCCCLFVAELVDRMKFIAPLWLSGRASVL